MTVEDRRDSPPVRAGGDDAVGVRIADERTPLLRKGESSSSSSGGGGFGDREFDGASFAGAVFNLSTTIIGAGIMALPATMKVLGLALGIAAIILVAALTDFSVRMLMRFSKAGGATSYGDVMAAAYGDFGRRLLQACVVINNIGLLVVYMIIIGDVLSGSSSDGVHHAGVLEGWFGPHWWTGRFFVLVVTTLSVFTPLACFKRIDSLRHTSAVAVLLALVFLVVTAGIAVAKCIQGSIEMPRLLPKVTTDIDSIGALFTAVPVLVTAYVCHFNVHNIENELDNPADIKPVVRASLLLCSITYIMISFFGFLLFGDNTLDDVLANFSTDLGIPFSSLLNDVVRVSYALHLMLVYPVIFYPLRLNMDGLLFPSSTRLADSNVRFATITIALITVAFLGANFIPSIWDAFQFTGATASVCLAFIFPAVIALRDAPRIGSRKDKIAAILMVILAAFADLMAIYSDSVSIFKENSSPSGMLTRRFGGSGAAAWKG
ncbi:amino acid transporter AVT6A-like [Andrographis paniculata]|uniref:amino acid transporter AVT6A-like n=1 Tax=Andrographis paniculata TaxID=175694 RepID=UPI0021E946AC|nr:amino acid transporter AVT6A-like [Andrographis paniculata]